MIVDQQCLIAFAFSFCEYNGRAVGRHDLGCETALLKHLFYKLRAFFQSDVLRADAWLRNIPFEFVKALIHIFFEIRIYLFEVAHDLLLLFFWSPTAKCHEVVCCWTPKLKQLCDPID